MTILLPVLVVVFALLATTAMVRHHDAGRRALALRRAGCGWMLAYGVLGGLFVAGETFSDPGGLAAVAMVLGWLVPGALLTALAWWRPRLAQPVLMVLVVAVVAYVAWSVVAARGPRGLRDLEGPFDAIAVLVVSVALGALGLRRPRAAGLMLLTTSLMPLVLQVVGASAPLSHAFSGSLGAASLPGLVSAALFLLAAREATHRAAVSRGPLPAPPR